MSAPASREDVALVTPDGARTRAELDDRVARVAAVLAESGVGPRARVALWAGTREASVLAILATIALGATAVPIHPRLTAPEAEALVRASTPARVFLEDDLDELLARALHPLRAPLSAPRVLAAVSRGDHAGRSADVPPAPLAILFTSGSTGRPKGALLPRDAFHALAEASAANLPWREGDRWLLAMPIAHVGGLSVVTRALVHARRGVVLHPRFEPDRALDAITRQGVTLLSVVPTMLRRLLDEDRANVLARARALLVGGAACPPALLEECARRGVLALTTYGLTEMCSQVTTQAPREPRATEPGSGRPLRGVELRIEDGRIHVRGATRMSGYLGEAPLAPSAWFDTGDLGEIDDAGRLHVHARRTDLIVTGGENVYPAEIEATLESLPGVRRALVFGVPDPVWGELVACAIERDPARDVPEPELHASMTRCLATHKRPRRVVFTSALPTAGDKLDRARGRETLASLIRPWDKR